MHADRPPASSWPLGTIIRVKIKAPKFPNHRVLVVLLPVLVVGCLFGVFPCSRVLSFVSLSLSPRRRRTLAGWLAGCLACALSCLFRGQQQQLPFLLGHQQPTNATGSVCSLFLPVCFSLCALWLQYTDTETDEQSSFSV